MQINATNLEEVVDFLHQYDYARTGYICFPDSSVVAAAQKDDLLRDILNNAILTLPDGKPSELVARLKGYENVSTVSGYWLCKKLLTSNLSHYFLGSTEEKVNKILASIKQEFPTARVAGFSSPPFQDVSFFRRENILAKEVEKINQANPDLIWVGISSPKQDFLMHTHVSKLNRGVMLGVGGVFDYLSGDVNKSPEWIKKAGLRWLWRLVREPGRLGPKYWFTIKTLVQLLFKKN